MVDETDFTGSGFGGGSPDQQQDTQDTGAIPDNTPQWGQSLSQDIGNIGSAIADSGQRGLNNAAGQVRDVQQASFAKTIAPKIMSYLSGSGAMNGQQWDALNNQVDPQGTMDQNERTMRAIDTASQQDPSLGAAALQHARVNYDLMKANAAKALASGNDTLAAQEATAAHNYLPDGSKTVFAPFKDGFAVSVQDTSGQPNNYVLDKSQMNAFLRGDHSLFDTVSHAGSGAMVQAVAKTGGIPVQQIGQNAQPSFPPDRQDTDERPVAPDPNARDGATPGQLPTFDPKTARAINTDKFAQTGQVSGSNTPTAGETERDRPVWVNNNDGSGTGYWKVPQPTYINPTDRDENTPAPGDESPINVNRRGANRLEGNASAAAGISQDQKNLAREIAPNNPSAQARIFGNTRAQASKEQTARDVANARAQGQVGAAAVRASAPARPGSDTAEARNTRNAATISARQVHDYDETFSKLQQFFIEKQGMKPEDAQAATQKMMDARGLKRPTMPGGSQQQQQPQGAQPIPQNGKAGLIPNTVYKTPRGNMRWDGNAFFPAGG